jgi:zinc protease
VLNQVLGGGNFRSRLMEEVRMEPRPDLRHRHLPVARRSVAALLGQFSSSNDLVGQAIEVIQGQWADIAANGITKSRGGRRDPAT